MEKRDLEQYDGKTIRIHYGGNSAVAFVLVEVIDGELAIVANSTAYSGLLTPVAVQEDSLPLFLTEEQVASIQEDDNGGLLLEGDIGL